MKDSYDLMKELLTHTLGYHGRLKSFIKAASYSQILFHKKGDINEPIVELDVNSLSEKGITIRKITNGKPKQIISLNSSLTFIIEIEIE
jgi:hypothetical protein